MATKPRVIAKRLVWRITSSAPMGEWVDPLAPARPAPQETIEGGSSNWVGSSFDLLRGTEVSDDPETQPDTLWDEFFGPAEAEPKKPDK